MSDKQYAKRDAAAKEYADRWPEYEGIVAAFNAGWEARKCAEYELMIESQSERNNG